MKRMLIVILSNAMLLASAGLVYAKGDYNDVPSGDKQYKDCIAYSKKNYDGGDEKSPIKGQTKAEAFCECMWNETSDDFRGNLAKFSETEKGKKVNKTCEKYSNWGD